MITICTWNDILALKKNTDSGLCLLLINRFKQLYQIFCSNGSQPLEHFSLQDYGEISIVEQDSEIAEKLFEQVTKHTIQQNIYYIAAFIFNNEICCDYLIPAENISDHQIKLLEQEL